MKNDPNRFEVFDPNFREFAITVSDPGGKNAGLRVVVEANLKNVHKPTLYVTYFNEKGSIWEQWEVSLSGSTKLI